MWKIGKKIKPAEQDKPVAEMKAECYLVVDSDGNCDGIRFKLPSGQYVGFSILPHGIKLLKNS